MRNPTWLVVAAALAGWRPAVGSAASGQVPVPPEAQQAFEQGLAAAQQEAWDVAARYFGEAQKAAPAVPPVLFNLGLAHAKAGHELAGIAWLRAYLAATPTADNADAVRAEIGRLTATVEAKRAAIFRAAVEAAQQLPDEPSGDRRWALAAVVRSQAYGGDLGGAMATSKLIGPDHSSDALADVRGDHAETLAAVGNVAGAQQLLAQVTATERQDPVWEAISESLQAQGDLVGAWKAAQRIQDDAGKRRHLQSIAERTFEAEGDLTPAEDVIPLLQGTDRMLFLLGIARRQCDTGDTAGARRTIDRMPANAYGKARALRELALVQFASGDVEGAKATANALLALKQEGDLVGDDDLALAQTVLGHVEEAYVLTARDVHYGTYLTTAKDETYGDIAFIQAVAGDMNAARKTATLAAEQSAKDSGDRCGLAAIEGKIAKAQAIRGDPAGALKTATASQETCFPFDRVLDAIIDAQLARGEFPQALQTAQELARRPRDERGVVDTAFGRIAAAQARAGELSGAEQTIALMSPSDEKVDAMIALVEAQRHTKAAAEAGGVLTAARDIAMSIHPASGDSLPDIVADRATVLRRLRQIAGLQASLGDQAGAEVTMARSELAQWLSLARGICRQQAVMRLTEELKNAATHDWQGEPVAPKDVPEHIAGVGRTLGTYLIAVQSLERRFAD